MSDTDETKLDLQRLASDVLAEIEVDGWSNDTPSPTMYFLDHPLELSYPEFLQIKRDVSPKEIPGWIQQIVIDPSGMHSMSMYHPDQGIMPTSFNPTDGIARRALTAIWNSIDSQSAHTDTAGEGGG